MPYSETMPCLIPISDTGGTRSLGHTFTLFQGKKINLSFIIWYYSVLYTFVIISDMYVNFSLSSAFMS